MGIGILWYTFKKEIRFPLGPALALSLGICSVGNHGLSKGENNMTLTFSGPHLPPASGHNQIRSLFSSMDMEPMETTSSPLEKHGL